MDVALLTVITVKTGLLMIACCAAAVSCVFAAYVSRDAHALYVMGCAAAALIVALALHLSYDAFPSNGARLHVLPVTTNSGSSSSWLLPLWLLGLRSWRR